MPKSGWLGLLALTLAAPLWAAERVVVVTSDVSDIVVALGAAGEVVGRDRSSRAPELAHAPEIGFSRSLSAETIARRQPTLVLGSAAAQPPTVWEQLERLRVRAVEVSVREDGSDFGSAIRKVGELVGRPAAAEALARDWQTRMAPRPATGKRYLVSYDGTLVSGAGTPADTLIRAAGGINAAAGLNGNKPLSREAWQALRPDVIILASHNAAVHGGAKAFARRPDIQATPAGRNGRVIEMTARDAMMVGLHSPAVVETLREL
ncbi:ABC transporter substrate-binding protein [Laribacter hongkongensis]|uniref:heme/hemin ABC transporter substrate-binding protein n=1 Tax=Laribacter hongkongensis TaxID=168471 RepID=UPI001EFE2358|nr:ABC transporter substrate-binding protein [Laribacter hongkongensis]MCG9053025.1 ABC transporter substrate-binding protein [Laribacter hongkongensis]MCG9081064.1 ABC transporter substrate-binding protein [Laribacter hongkongensis]